MTTHGDKVVEAISLDLMISEDKLSIFDCSPLKFPREFRKDLCSPNADRVIVL